MGKYRAIDSLNHLCCSQFKNHSLIKKLRPFVSTPIWSQQNRQFILNTISEALLCQEMTAEIAKCFAPILLDLFHRLKSELKYREKLFIAISDLIGYYSDATNFGYECFQRSLFSPINLLKTCDNENSKLSLIKSVFNYLYFNPIWFRNAIDCSFITDYISHSNTDIKYIAIQCYIILFSLNSSDSQKLIQQRFSVEEQTQLKLKYFNLFSQRIPLADISTTFYYDESDDEISNSMQSFCDSDFSEDIVSVFGILINKCKSLSLKSSDEHNIVLLPSTKKSLRLLALAVSYGKPVLIEGPVGCGKTLLIELIASLTGRMKAPQLIKVQMGDQIDSKILIGSHICTDIPGEFVWKAGPLTQAMRDGNWLLMEDIDCAPSDVIAMLSSVLEAKSLSSLPGCENKLQRVHNEFRIFFTRRLMNAQYNEGKHSEFAIRSSTHYNSINKLCYTISLELLSREELSTLISTKWPNLSTIKNRILDIYFNLQTDNRENFGSKRLLSLRDLIKWCNRISKKFKLDSEESALSAFLDANDCFLQCIPSSAVRNGKAELIGSNLNISKAQSQYLCAKRKPEFLMNEKCFKIGRLSLDRNKKSHSLQREILTKNSFAFTHQSLSLLEKISVAIENNEPVLLCGETGTGKTSSVQYLAHQLDKPLTVVNMNQQSDSSDLLGGYKPIEMRILIQPLRDEYLDLFSKTFQSDKNASFLTKFAQKYNTQDWPTLFKVMIHVYQNALNKCKDKEDVKRWNALGNRITHLQSCKLNEKGCLAFSFIEGSLVKAMKSGGWILLDEINLAESETLQCLSAILDSKDGSIMLLDKADGLPVERHHDFRLFACMNPATDIGKKELPLGIRNRFTEFFVDELEDKSDLRILIHSYIGNFVSPALIESIVDFYLKIKNDAKQVLTDTTGSRPIYSLRFVIESKNFLELFFKVY
jgi:midasin